MTDIHFQNVIATYISSSPEQTEQIATNFVREILPGGGKESGLVLLYGEMGAGKTAFVRGMCRVIAPDAQPSSPTYSLINEYAARSGVNLVHCDLYRITSEDDFDSIGLDEYLENAIVAIEWPSRAAELCQMKHYSVTINITNETEREVIIENFSH